MTVERCPNSAAGGCITRRNSANVEMDTAVKTRWQGRPMTPNEMNTDPVKQVQKIGNTTTCVI
jgi:hypothetical protein